MANRDKIVINIPGQRESGQLDVEKHRDPNNPNRIEIPIAGQSLDIHTIDTEKLSSQEKVLENKALADKEIFPPEEKEFEYLAREKIALDLRKVRSRAETLAQEPGFEAMETGRPDDPISISVASLAKDGEDSFLLFSRPDKKIWALAVADGVGGHAKGEVASRLAKENVIEALKKIVSSESIDEEGVILAVKEALKASARELKNPESEYTNADTTFTTAVVMPEQGTDSYKAIFIHVGDTRGGVFRNGKFEQITEDETLVANLRNADLINSDLAAKTSHQKSELVRALRSLADPGKEPQVIVRHGLKKGDRILVSSDGFHDGFRDDRRFNEPEIFLNAGLTPRELVAAALLRKQQNIKGLSHNDDTTVGILEIAK